MASRIIVVGNQSGADAPTLTAALACAAPGDTVVVSPGVYEETVHLGVDVTVMSASPADDEAEEGSSGEVVRATVRGPIVVSANARLENMEVHGMVSVRKGHATLERCEIHHGTDGVRAYAGTTVEVRSCRIHDCAAGGDGVYFMSGAAGVVSDTDVYDCRVHGVHVRGSSVALQGNRIRDCTFGIYYEMSASGSCEGNTVEHARRFGIVVADASSPSVTRNSVRECGLLCLYVSSGGTGFCSQNTFDGSVHILSNCPIQLSGNRISGMADVDPADVGEIAAI
ncbi:hypothetical protein ABB37_04875 [Leptomonas pyrrhocoris]|uniref:Right handed beta helix domain-containing protein n=1 Tax=Leptomonas pyrrhocoris TaxID=157538 RepID=A0A0N0VFC7_LEPPY|nr:hypothetical protein ABB37_04875 [Leptomonas pyrrhocoris]KPA80702.1 hypothetical protein ABB37_04875 [Leptomonas pyrrhocoris]|eukprot:XP_015659141.1 hypothetical protein ABB37_04875 [Leptomonas pyrrhocoris]